MKKLLLITSIFLAASGFRLPDDINDPVVTSKGNEVGGLITSVPLRVESIVCSTGRATLVKLGLDLNRNGSLEENEVQDSQVVCK